MRAIFGVLSLLIVLAIVGSLARKNLQASVVVPVGVPGTTATDVSGLTVPQQSKALQDKIRDDTARALQQGAERTQRADPN